MQSFRNLQHRLLTSVAFIALSCSIAAAQDLKAKLPIDPNVVTGKLDNGLTYYIRNNHKPEHKVELRMVVKAGSILENDDQQGLAHFMEHMNFNGTKNFQKNDLVGYLQSIGVEFGADLNAYTSFDETVYILPIPTDKPDNLEKGFQIIEDWAHNALLTNVDIDEERGVVLEESRLGKGADDRMMKKYFPKMVEGSAYANRLPIGKDEIIKNSTYDKVRNFYHDWYRPDLQAVVVVGDIDVETAKKMIVAHFGSLKNPEGERERKYATVTSRTEPDAMVVTDKEASRTALSIMFPNKVKKDLVTVGDYRNKLKRDLMQQMMDRRFNDLVRSSNPPFPYAGAGFGDWIHGYENFTIYTSFTAAGGPQKALDAATGVVLSISKFGFDNNELELAKKELMSRMEKQYNERNTTESENYVDEYVRGFLDKEAFPGIANEYTYYKEMLPGIKLADLNMLVKEWTASANTFTLITAPDKSDVKLPTDAELKAMVAQSFKQEPKKLEEQKVVTTLMATTPTPGKVVSQTKEAGFDATTYTLSNGIKVTIKTTNFKSDEILMEGIKKGGYNSYGVKDKESAHFATDVVKAMGVGDFNPNDLDKATAGKTMSVSLEMENINDNISASSTVKDFEAMLQLTNLYITAPRKDEGLFAAYKEKQKAEVQFLGANPQYSFYDTMFRVMFNNNPLMPIVIPKAEYYDKIDLSRAMEIYHDEFGGADGYHFFITGNVNAATALPLIQKYLGSIPITSKKAAFKDNGLRRVKGSHIVVYKKGTEKQSLVLGNYYGDAPYSEDFELKVKAVAEVLNIKVIEDLREKMGGIYSGGFFADVERDPYPRYNVQLYLPCGPENVDKLVAAANDEIKSIKTAGPDAKNLDKVKNQWHEKHVTELKENKYWNEKMQSVLFWRKDKDRVLNYEKYIQKLTPADLKAAAKKVFEGNSEFTAELFPEQ